MERSIRSTVKPKAKRKATARRVTDLSTRLAVWRSARDVSLADMAAAAHVTKSAICHYEAGKAEPSHDRLIALVTRGLGISMGRFYGPLPVAA
jgi:transcriptional regulator with XRE-family HTH domain